MKLQQNIRLAWVRFWSLVALYPIPFKNLQVIHPYQPQGGLPIGALGFPDLLLGRHYDVSVCPRTLWRIMPKTWRGFPSFPDLPRFLPSMSICLNPWENDILILLYWFGSLYMKTTALEACDYIIILRYFLSYCGSQSDFLPSQFRQSLAVTPSQAHKHQSRFIQALSPPCMGKKELDTQLFAAFHF